LCSFSFDFLYAGIGTKRLHEGHLSLSSSFGEFINRESFWGKIPSFLSLVFLRGFLFGCGGLVALPLQKAGLVIPAMDVG
jgi:hypothetical protein